MNEIVVIGIGQELRGDDGAGLAVVCRWQRQYPQTSSRVRVELCPLPGLDLLNVWDGARVAIIVDAVLSGARPGSLYELNGDDLVSFGAGAASAHGWGLAETLKLAAELAPSGAAPEIRILAISGSDFELGTGLSPAVKKAIPRVAERLEEMVNGVPNLDAVVDSRRETKPRLP